MKSYYTKYERYLANQVQMMDIMLHFNEPFEKSGHEHRWLVHHSVTFTQNKWFRHSKQKGGYPIDFLMKFYDYTYPQAVGYLLDHFDTGQYKRNGYDSSNKELDIPTPSSTIRNIFTYLCAFRFLDKTLVNTLITDGLLYEDQQYHNCVFVGKDEYGNIKHIHKRSSFDSMYSYKGNSDGSISEYSFHIFGTSNELFVFEAPIDLCSYISLHLDSWKNHSYVALCGVASKPIEWILIQKPIQKVHLCLDNDFAGQEANFRIKMELLEKYDIEVDEIVPRFKDFNEDLKFKYNQPVLGGISDPFNELVEEQYQKIIQETKTMKDQRFKDLLEMTSLFVLSKISGNPKQRQKGYDALIEIAKISLLLARQQYRHLEKQYTIQELIHEIQEEYGFVEYYDKDEKSNGILKEFSIIKDYFTTLDFDTKEDKEHLIEACKNLAKRSIYTYVYLTLKERTKQQ